MECLYPWTNRERSFESWMVEYAPWLKRFAKKGNSPSSTYTLVEFPKNYSTNKIDRVCKVAVTQFSSKVEKEWEDKKNQKENSNGL